MLPLALAAVAQAIVVIAGGIDLSIGSMMALTSVVSATLMKDQSEEFGVARRARRARSSAWSSAPINGGLVVVTRVPDIVVTLAMSFVWAGFALLVRPAPGGGAATWLKDLVVGPFVIEWVPKAAVVLVVIVAVIWIPVSRSRLGLSMYAIGSNRLAAFRSGVSVGRTKVVAYVITGPVRGARRPLAHREHGIGSPVPGPYTLMSVAAVVLGGVSLAGGRGGVFGPIVAVVVLQLIADGHDVPQRRPQPGVRRPGRDPHRRADGRQRRRDAEERGHERVPCSGYRWRERRDVAQPVPRPARRSR